MNKEKETEMLFEELLRAIADGTLVIVEGEKDRKALQNLGIKNIFVINEHGKSFYEKIERIAEKIKEAMILTDLDTEGKKLYSIIKRSFSNNGVRINDKIRDLLIKLKISHVEGLSTFIDNCECDECCSKAS